jgi:AraC-like DNA-binding protein
MSRRVVEPGILRPGSSLQNFDYVRHQTPENLSPWVENFWTITWDLPPGEPYTAEVLPYPSVNASVTDTEADVTGLVRRRYLRHLAGRGYGVGARFRPACFRPFLGGPVSQLTDRHRPISVVFGRDTSELEGLIAAEPDPTLRVVLLAGFLADELPERDPMAELLADVVGWVAANREVIRVSQVSGHAGMTVRTLQRGFAEYVGAGPKWVIQRCRLQDAAARAAAAEPVEWAALAAELGFADQAHLTRAFTATVGVPPAVYTRQARPAESGARTPGVSDAVRTPVR